MNKKGFKLNNRGSVRDLVHWWGREGGRDGGSAKGSEIDCGWLSEGEWREVVRSDWLNGGVAEEVKRE